MIDPSALLCLLEDLSEQAFGYLPDKNCSCHISPPCHDCVTHSYARELEQRTRLVCRELRLAALIAPAIPAIGSSEP